MTENGTMLSKQPKFLTSTEALKEVLMDSDSDDMVSDSDNDPVLDDSDNDPNYVEPRQSRSTSESEHRSSDEEQVQPLLHCINLDLSIRD